MNSAFNLTSTLQAVLWFIQVYLDGPGDCPWGGVYGGLCGVESLPLGWTGWNKLLQKTASFCVQCYREWNCLMFAFSKLVYFQSKLDWRIDDFPPECLPVSGGAVSGLLKLEDCLRLQDGFPMFVGWTAQPVSTGSTRARADKSHF